MEYVCSREESEVTLECLKNNESLVACTTCSCTSPDANNSDRLPASTVDMHSMLDQCWDSVADGGPTLN